MWLLQAAIAPAKVIVTYPDRSKDTVDVNITVKPKLSDADKNEPKGKDQTVEKGDTPKAENSVDKNEASNVGHIMNQIISIIMLQW